MTSHAKYLVTLDEETGDIVKVEKLGEAGDLTEIPDSPFQPIIGQSTTTAAAGSYVVNIYMGEGAPPQVTTRAFGQPKPPADVGILPSPGATNPPRPRPKPDKDEDGDDGGKDGGREK